MAELNKSTGDTFTATDCDAIDQQMVVQTTSDRTGVEGRLQARTDLDQVQVYTGSVWRPAIDYGTPATWTPTVTQSGTVTCTVNTATYFEFGSLVVAWFMLTVTGSGTVGNNVSVSLPVTSATSTSQPVGPGYVDDASGPLKYAGSWVLGSTTTVLLDVHAGATGTFGTSPAIALAASDVIRGQLIYYR